MGIVAMKNLRSVDDVLERQQRSGLADGVKKLGGNAPARMFLRHLAAEQNRGLFEIWDWAQIAISLALLLFIVFGTREGKITMIIALVPILILFVQHMVLMPAIVGLGRELDFMDPSVQTPIRRQFGMWHGLYSALDLAKLTVLSGLTFLMIRSNGSSPRRRAEDVDDSGKMKRRTA